MTNLIAKLFGVSNNQQYKVIYKDCADSVTAEIRKFPGLEAQVITLPENNPYCYAHLPMPRPITSFSRIPCWKLNEGIDCILYNLISHEPWALGQKTGAEVCVRKQSVDVYSHPNYFGEAVELAQRLVSKS